MLGLYSCCPYWLVSNVNIILSTSNTVQRETICLNYGGLQTVVHKGRKECENCGYSLGSHHQLHLLLLKIDMEHRDFVLI